MANPEEVKGKDVLVSSPTLCYLFNVSARELTNWERLGCPKEGRGRWSLRKVIAWRSGEMDIGVAGADRTKIKDAKLKAEAMLKAAQANKAKRELEILEGKYLPLEEIEQEWAGRIVELKAGLMNWIKALPPELSGADARTVEAALRREVAILLEQYSREGTYTPRVETDDAEVVTP
mgnify:CR=1 FL=1